MHNQPDPAKKIRHQPKRKCLPTVTNLVPDPSNKTQYTPNEIIKIVSPLPGNTKNKPKVIKDIVSKKLVPISVIGIYKLLQRHREGKVIEAEWNKTGRKRLLDDTDIQDINLQLNKRSGSTIANKEILKKIQTCHNNKVI